MLIKNQICTYCNPKKELLCYGVALNNFVLTLADSERFWWQCGMPLLIINVQLSQTLFTGNQLLLLSAYELSHTMVEYDILFIIFNNILSLELMMLIFKIYRLHSHANKGYELFYYWPSNCIYKATPHMVYFYFLQSCYFLLLLSFVILNS